MTSEHDDLQPEHAAAPDAADAARIADEVAHTDWQVSGEPEPLAAEGDSIAWMADSETHLADVEPHEPQVVEVSGPLPVCDYTGDDDEPCEEPSVQRRWSGAAVITAATMGAVVGGLFVAAGLVWAFGYLPVGRPLANNPVGVKNGDSPAIQITPGGSMADVSEAVAAKVVPSVVNVTVVQDAFDPFSGSAVTREAGNGSGVIVREDGYILTNNHVIEGADRIVVTVGVEDIEAKVVGTDPSSDLAVLKIEGSGYPAADLGTSKDLKVGQYVMAVGSPFGLEKTVTVGIVSALNRSELVEGPNDLTTYTNLIQTDAAINPGNSGGALVDDAGELVGINTLIQSPSGAVGAPQSAGIGFAIPIDFAQDIARQIIETGSATHPYMGVSTETVDPNVAAEFGLRIDSGALVRFVQPDSPADRAGIERGDIIVAIGKRPVESVEDVFAAIRENRVGDEVGVDIVRNDTRRTVTIVLGSDSDRQ